MAKIIKMTHSLTPSSQATAKAMTQAGLQGVTLGYLAFTQLQVSSTGHTCHSLSGYQRVVLSIWVCAASSWIGFGFFAVKSWVWKLKSDRL